MRIISGIAKGRRLATPKTASIRPVADKVKGAIFNILPSMEESRVLDLFAGTGSVGLEALSRGADFVVFVDSGFESLTLLRKNIQLCGFDKQTSVVKGYVPAILSRLVRLHDRFDFIFVDPPYDKGLVNKSLEGLIANNLIDAKTTVIIEHSPREMPNCEGLTVSDQRKYGQTLITFMKCA